MSNIRLWLKGYIDICINGKENERFISLCKNNKLKLYNIKKKDKVYTCSIEIEDYRKIKKIVRKTHVIPKIEERKGLPFMYSKYKNRQSFILGLMLGLFLFYICSGFIWTIQIEGSNYYTEEEIIRCLRKENIYTGMRRNSVRCEEIENIIRKKYKDIGWVSAQLEGTYIKLRIKENVKYDTNKSSKKARNIIASAEGVVDNIFVRQGEPLVDKGDKVKKGDVLVSGIVDILDDAGNVVEKKAVSADADVYIKYDEEYYSRINRRHSIKEYTGKNRRSIKVLCNNMTRFTMDFYLPLTKQFDNYDIIVNNYNVVLWGRIYTPITFVMENKLSYSNKQTCFTNKELIKKAQHEYKKYKEELKEENKEIINSDIEYIMNEEDIVTKGYVCIKQKVESYSKITKNELKVEIRETQGDI